MRIVFIMDPPSTVLVDEDTSFALMLEAQARAHRVDHCIAQDVFLDGARLAARVRPARCQRDPDNPIELGEPEDVDLAEVDVIFVRKDPPFDDDYLFLSLMLEHVRDRTLIVNDPRGLRDANEKIYATYFPELMPRTLISNDKARIRAFMKDVGGKAVVKPLWGAGGAGVFAITEGDPNLNSIIETVTQSGDKLVMAQQYLPAVQEGDKRVLLLDGEYLGSILRIPQGGDLRSNIHVGGRVDAAQRDDADQKIIDAVAPRLRRDGLFFVGLDVIGGYLTEVNVTSPTGIQQASRLAGENLEARVIDWLEARVG